MKIQNSIALLSLSIILLLGCQRNAGGPSSTKKILAKVNGQEITLERFQESFNRFVPEVEPSQLHGDDLKELKRSLLNQLIEEELILGEARKMGVEVKEEEISLLVEAAEKEHNGNGLEAGIIQKYGGMKAWKEELKRRLLIQKVIDGVVYSKVVVTEEEALNYYKSYPDEYKTRERVRARMIVVKTEEEANQVRARIKRGEEFAKVAEEVSLGPEGKRGGYLGFFGKGEMPKEFDEVVFSLPVGKLSPVVKTSYGYHIFLVEEKRKPGDLKFSEVKDQLMARLKREKAEGVFQGWLKGLKEKAKIEVREELL